MVNRRSFVFGGGAFALAAGCRSVSVFGSPEMTFGLVSDIHITTPGSCRLLKQSFEYFKRRGVDAVVIPGDLTDWGLISSLGYVKHAWDEVFAGTETIPLFCTGNHDFEGWVYGDMAMEMHANGYSEHENLKRAGMAQVWERIFGEPYAPVRLRSVKGYNFVSCEFSGGEARLEEFFAREGAKLGGEKPFFYFQHLPIRGTTVDSYGWADSGKTKTLLEKFPNCIAITGHTHRPFLDERSIWQDRFTVVNVPSLSYACLPEPDGHENGSDKRDGSSVKSMQMEPYRRDLRGGQGYVVNVWRDRVVFERIDLEELEHDGPDWVVPIGASGKKYGYGEREKLEPIPAFPAGAKLKLETRNTENRSGKRIIAMDCRFPTAMMPEGSRVFDYEIRVVPRDGSASTVKSYYSPAYARMAKFEPKEQRFWFDAALLPQAKEYVIEVRARNCFKVASEPIVSGVMKGEPGLEKVVRQ